MKYKKVKIGDKFTRLTVEKEIGRKNKRKLWLYVCDCGNKTTAISAVLNNGNKRSCGCLRKEAVYKLNKMKIIHGHSKKKGKASSEYHSWSGMKRRCYNKKTKDYKNYGERGIKVCDKWNSFENFLADMGLKPGPKYLYSIDRIDNDGDYCPKNCRWATAKEQQNNKRINKTQKWFRAHNKELNAIRYSNNQCQFARDWELNNGSISRCLNKMCKRTKNWTFKFI